MKSFHYTRRNFVAFAVSTAAAFAMTPRCSEAEPSARPAQLRGKWGDQGDGTYVNPIVPADYSDIDVIKVDDVYYAVSSTLHMSPGMVLLESKDLVNWKVIGHAVPDISLLGDTLTWQSMSGYARGVWAGALRFRKGLFYLYFTCPDSGVYVTTAAKANGPWSALKCLWQTPGFDDPCPFWDEDGKAYLAITRFATDPETHQAYNVYLYSLSDDGGSIDVSSGRLIHHSPGSEANKLYKIKGLYYHYFSEVRPEGRVAMMKRAVSLEGPWEEQQLNHVDKRIDKEPNQGGLVEAAPNSWWFLTHQGTGDWEGRALCLLPVHWVDGWPVIGKVGVDGIGDMVWQADKPIEGTLPALPSLSDDFSADTLGPQWEWNHSPRGEMWSLTERRGWLRLSAFRSHSGTFATVGNVVSQRAWRTAKGRVVTCLDTSLMADGQTAGISHASSTYALIGVVKSGIEKHVIFQNNASVELGRRLKGNKIWLKTEWDFDGIADFSFSLDGRRFESLGTKYNLAWGHYRGDRVGLFTYNERADTGDADFSHFSYSISSQIAT